MRIKTGLPAAAFLLSVLLCAFLAAHRTATRAADSESVTWGATDPTWSPDGAALAFSLFGSIWQVPASGGEATQITTSSGYHAHPAWSPKGDKIAFIRGLPPTISTRPSISGDLMVVDVSTGEEHKIDTPDRVAGTLAWSPDGPKFALALLPSRDGAIVYEADVATGRVYPVLGLPQSFRESSTWVDLAWNRSCISDSGEQRPTQVLMSLQLPADFREVQHRSNGPAGAADSH